MEENENHEVHEEEYNLENDEDVDIEEVAVAAYNRVDALVELLVKKGIITETEIDLMEDSMVEDDDMDDNSHQNQL
jgi:hypothetical protein